MDDLLLFTPTKKSHMANLGLLKVLLKMDSRYLQRNARKKYNIWGMLYLLRIKEYVSNHCEIGWKLFKIKAPYDSKRV